MPGKRAFLRRRHVAAGASHANRGPRVPTRASLLFVAFPRDGMALLPRRFRCSGRGRPCAPGRLAAGDLGSCDCRQRYPARVASEPAALMPVPSSLSAVRLRVSVDEEVLDAGRSCGVGRLQITCHRRSENPSAVTANTPQNGLEITAAVRFVRSRANHVARAGELRRRASERVRLPRRTGADAS